MCRRMIAPSVAPIGGRQQQPRGQSRFFPEKSRYAQPAASEPGVIATALVAFAITGGIPDAIAAGNESSVPPPATELIAPAATDEPTRKASRARFMTRRILLTSFASRQ